MTSKPLPSQKWLQDRFDYRDGYLYHKKRTKERYAFLGNDGRTKYHMARLRYHNDVLSMKALIGGKPLNPPAKGRIPGWHVQKAYLAHRVIWKYVKGVDPVGHITHINGDLADNRIENLRDLG